MGDKYPTSNGELEIYPTNVTYNTNREVIRTARGDLLNVYQTGVTTGNTPENNYQRGVVAWHNGRIVASTDPQLRQQVEAIVRAIAIGGITPTEENQLNYTISDIMDDRRLNGSAPRITATTQR